MADITLAATVVWVHEGPFGEELIFSYHTGSRNGPEITLLLGQAVLWWQTDLLSTMKNRVTLRQVRYLEWDSDTSRFEQRGSIELTTAGGTVATLPPQCAVVVTYRYNDAGVPQRQRYNRAYHGYIATTQLESADGRLTDVARDGLRSDILELHARFKTVDAQNATLEGLCVVSVVGGVITPATEVGVGLVVDTQRRRRADYPDEKEYVALP